MKPAAIGLSAVLALALSATPAWAHKGSDAYLEATDVVTPGTTPGAVRLSLALAIKDLDLLLPIDANADGRVTWGEIRSATPAALALLQGTTALELSAPADGAAGGNCPLRWTLDGLERRSDGAYMRFTALAACPAGAALGFRYTLFREQDATHRLIITGHTGQHDLLATASPLQATPVPLRAAQAGLAGPGAAAQGPWSVLLSYLALGTHHLWEGYDHMAFLLALVLPLRLRLGPRKPRPRAGRDAATLPTAWGDEADSPNLAHAWWGLLRTITAFTIGHSITLMLATIGWTQASPVWVEPAIAASIGFTAWLNLRPVPKLRIEYLALGFGLVHGFGFAGLLQEAAAPTGLLPWALAGFNLGVEVGQLTAVCAWVLLAQLVVRRPWYGSVVVRGGSVVLLLLSLWWFWQRLPA